MTEQPTLEQLFDVIATIGTLSVSEFEPSVLTDGKKRFHVTITRKSEHASMVVKSNRCTTLRAAVISAIQNANALFPTI